MTMEGNSNRLKVIDIRNIFQKLWEERRKYIIPLAITFVVACVYIFSIPRYYTSGTKLAPEIETSLSGGLSSIASSFGIDINNMQTSDAITPLLYPDLMDDNGFITSLFSVKLESKDKSIQTTYADYIVKHQKKPWWSFLTKAISQLLKEDEPSTGEKLAFNPYDLTKKENNIAEFIRKNISISVNSKTGVISISAQAQDPLICKTLADSVRVKLQSYITTYRTNKARNDYEYYKQLTNTAKQEYEKIRRQYASMSDATTNVSLRSVVLKMEDVENDMQLKLNAYTTLNSQLQAAKAKVQERTPAFTILQGASVPMKPAGPKRMIFVAGMLLLAFIGTSIWILRKGIADIFA